MNIMLGNLNIDEIERRCGVKFPEPLIDFMADRKQENASVSAGEWHCFDIPFTILCGDIETAKEIFKHLSPFTDEFKEPLQIAINKGGERK